MKTSDAQEVAGRSDHIFCGTMVGEVDGRLAIDGKVPIPIVLLQSNFAVNTDLPLILSDRTSIGTLCFTRRRGVTALNEMTDWQRAAWFADVDLEQAEFSKHSFNYNYVVIDEPYYWKYKNDLATTAPLWGGFSDQLAFALPARVEIAPSELVARDDLFVPTGHHRSMLQRTVEAAHPYDRYLRLYHNLELLFDWVVVREVGQLSGDLNGLGKLMSSYSAADFARLKSVVSRFTNESGALEERIGEVSKFATIAEAIFQTFGKDSNPLRDSWTQFMAVVTRGPLTEESLRAGRFPFGKDYGEFIRQVVAYWIFRVRCCVAHNRIGEYVLSDNDENFVVSFAEPLLREVVLQTLRSPDLIKLK